MAKHCVAPQVEAELQDIWHYIADHSGSIEIADRLIDSITTRFFLLAQSPHWVADAMTCVELKKLSCR